MALFITLFDVSKFCSSFQQVLAGLTEALDESPDEASRLYTYKCLGYNGSHVVPGLLLLYFVTPRFACSHSDQRFMTPYLMKDSYVLCSCQSKSS